MGNVTPHRILLVLILGGAMVGLFKVPLLPQTALFAIVGSLAVLTLLVGGLLYTPALRTGVIQTVNVAEGILLFFAALCIGLSFRRPEKVSEIRQNHLAAVPLWGYLPSGLISIYQAIDLMRGQPPKIPLIGLANLEGVAVNSGRTTFGYGLNQYGLDRVAAATGDPPTFGIFSAIIVSYCYWALRREHLRSSPFVLCSLMLAGLGVILSASISAGIVLIVGLTVNLWPNGRSKGGSSKVVSLVGVFCFTIILLVALVPRFNGFLLSFEERLSHISTSRGSVSIHVDLLGDAWELFGNNPLLGVGTAGLGFHTFGSDAGFSSVHNTLLLGLAEGGILLGGAILALWVTLSNRLVPLPLLAPAVSGWLIYLDFNRMPAIWVILGLGAALAAQDSILEESARSNALLLPSRPEAKHLSTTPHSVSR